MSERNAMTMDTVSTSLHLAMLAPRIRYASSSCLCECDYALYSWEYALLQYVELDLSAKSAAQRWVIRRSDLTKRCVGNVCSKIPLAPGPSGWQYISLPRGPHPTGEAAAGTLRTGYRGRTRGNSPRCPTGDREDTIFQRR